MPDTRSRWFLYSLIAIGLYGVWGLVATAATQEMKPLVIQVISTLGLIPVAIYLAFSPNLRQGPNLRKGMVFAFLTGICGSTGNVCLLVALDRGGEASVIIPLTGMYPLVTVLLARIFLREKMNRVQGVGFVLALVAIWLFNMLAAGEPAPDGKLWTGWHKLMTPPMAFAFVTLILFGVAAVTQKFSTNNISNELSTIVFAVAFVPVAVFILVGLGPFEWKISVRGWSLALLFGALIGTGTLALFAAYRWGKASIVTALTGLYPALTVILAIPIFHESLSLEKIVAIALALAAGAALTYEKSEPNAPVIGR